MGYVTTRRVHHDGQEYEAGTLLGEITEKQAEALVAIGAIKPSEELAVLMGMSVDKLGEIVTAEEIELPEGAKTKAQIAAVIIATRAHRADQTNEQPAE